MFPNPEQYEIRVAGRLAPRWAGLFAGMTVSQQDDGTTVIYGPVVDQSALHAVLRAVGDLGLPLVSITHSAGSPAGRPHRHTRGARMTTIDHSPRLADSRAATPASPRRMSATRRIALAAGLLYLLTFVASIPQLFLFKTITDDPEGWVTGRGSTTPVLWGSWFEVITAFAGVGTAVALYPITRRVSRTAAIGFVTSRVVEAGLILVGVVSLLAVVTLRADLAGAGGARGAALRVTAHALVEMRQWTFLVGPGVVAGVNALFLGSAMFRSRLVPRIIPAVGLAGAPLIIFSASGTMFGLWDQVSGPAFALGLPVAAWELSLGVWLTVKGFRAGAVAALDAAPDSVPGYVDGGTSVR